VLKLDLADAFGDLADDSDFKTRAEDNKISLLPDKNSKDQDKNLKKVMKMFQNKDDPNMDSLIDNLPDPNKIINNYPGELDDDDDMNGDFYNPYIGTRASKKKARTKKAANFEDESIDRKSFYLIIT
jgi:hypothetical protein